LQRVFHWLMSLCIFAMLFIGVGMVSTVTTKYLGLVSIHKPLGITILVLALIRLALRLYYGAPALPADLPEPMKLAAKLSHYAFYALMIAMPLLGWAMLSAAGYPVVLYGGLHLPPSWREPRAAYDAVGCSPLSGIRVLRLDPHASWRGSVSQVGAARRRVRGDGPGSGAGPTGLAIRHHYCEGPINDQNDLQDRKA
jgi:cytochrome b561